MMRFTLAALLVLMPLLVSRPALATEFQNVLVTDVSKDQISIRSNYSGETLLLFGAIDTQPYGEADGVVVVLRGPAQDIILRKKNKQFGIWVNGPAYTFGDLPSFYAVASSRPIADLLPNARRAELGIGADVLKASNLDPKTPHPTQGESEAVAAFLRLKQQADLFAAQSDAVEIIHGKLFRAEINLPAGMPVGAYTTEFFAFQKGTLIGYQKGELPVDIVGAGHILHEAAYNMSLLYGIFGVAVAVFMGWAVAIIFRRR
ncbi:MAG: TIGR02186 family protein [Alphaproteobacteria bacterium]|nr:TIGR02186 family protein [Alphaproteobacteria bacterium]